MQSVDLWTIPDSKLKDLFNKRKTFLWKLCQCVNAEYDFSFSDWEILFYTLENFNPDFIFELGRGMGNSTCVFIDYCLRHKGIKFTSLDLYDNWHQETLSRLPNDLPNEFFKHDFKHFDFMEYDLNSVFKKKWKRMLIFWDVNDEAVANRMTQEFLPQLSNRKILVCMHDVSHNSGRPRRYHWREYESLYQDIEIVGKFLDKSGWHAKVPEPRKIFGYYRNAGHWLIFESPASIKHSAEHSKDNDNEC